MTSSKLIKYADAVIETVWLLALTLAPLFFNAYSQRVFEPDKISLVRTMALFGLAAGLIKLFETLRWRRDDEKRESEVVAVPFWRRPLVWPVLALAAAYLLSTLLSVTPRQSFWGSYQRLQGAFSMFSYIFLFLITLNALRTEQQWRRLQYTIILVSFPIALYGMMQHFHLDPLPWGGDTVIRVASTMGNAIFLAAYLIMAVPLTIERLVTTVQKMLLDERGGLIDSLSTAALLTVLVIQFIAILFTQSRGPWIGLAVGLYIFGLLALTGLRQQSEKQGALHVRDVAWGVSMGLAGLLALAAGLLAMIKVSGALGILLLLLAIIVALALYLVPLFRRWGWRWLWLSFITQSLLAALMVVLLNVSPGFMPGFGSVPYIGRLSHLMDFEHGTGRVRVLIWQGAVEMMLQPHPPLTYPDGHADPLNSIRPLIGYGPESMWVAYNPYYKPELGDLERRNASPDRSHNETFDSLISTGLLGLLAYFALFFSIFYYALKWLGLIADRVSRTLFFVLGLAGALLGVLTPWIAGVPYFLGVGLPLGFILGMLVYITYAAFRGSDEIFALQRRQLLIIALLATLVAHFVEIHFGIAIVSTRTYFFILAAALVALGSRPFNFQKPTPEPVPLGQPHPRVTTTRKGKRKERKNRRSSMLKQKNAAVLPWRRQTLPYAVILGIVFVVLDWNFISGQIGSASTVTVFFESWFIHLKNGVVTPGRGPIILIAFTLIVGIVLALAEVWRPTLRPNDIWKTLGMTLSVSLGMWLTAGLIMAARLTTPPAGMTAMQQADRIVSTIGLFYVLILISALLLAAVLARNDRRPTTQWARQTILSGLGGLVVVIFALILVINVNLRLVQADMFFKIGQSADARNDWQTALVFYQKASDFAPKEDYYLLFVGRALLQRAQNEQDATARSALFSRSQNILLRAQALNPLNTDHSANLARFYATQSATFSDPAAQRQALLTASAAYEVATRLSPHAAHLQNEWGSVLMRLGEHEQARKHFQQALALDPQFADTYLRLAQLDLQQEDWEAAYEAYTKLTELKPRDPRGYSGQGYALAKMGRTQEAIAANLKVLQLSPNDLNSLQNLALLYQESGKYDDALIYAKRALQAAPEAKRPGLEALIKQLEQAQDANQ
ncbi:MAG: hypothetical protein DSY55_05210 [Clostridia bacterium]|nr:MAG: hypothetical protein DSY55_05210 [Clostridia bacterium]